MFETREQKQEKGRQISVAAIKAVEQAAKEASMDVAEWSHKQDWQTPGTTVDGIGVLCTWRIELCRLIVRIQIGEYGERRSYPVREDGSFNVRAVLDRVRAVQQLRKDRDQQVRASELQRQDDEAREQRLAALHKGIGMLRVECEYGLTKVIASGLGEEEAKRALAALAEVLRPMPSVGEVWQHRKVQMPSRITSVKGMIKLVGVQNSKTCAIPKREFIDGWELVSAAPEQP